MTFKPAFLGLRRGATGAAPARGPRSCLGNRVDAGVGFAVDDGLTIAGKAVSGLWRKPPGKTAWRPVLVPHWPGHGG